MINLQVKPGFTCDWESFRQSFPLYSIALDGLVTDATARDLAGPFANFDHHAGVDRLVARSTCEQVHIEINMGLFDIFRKDGIPYANIFINDCDEDTCLAVWLLLHHEQVVNNASPPINRLVYCEDRLDATGGAYPLGDRSIVRKMAWIFDPYNKARFSGMLKSMDGAGLRTIVEAVCHRINDYVLDGGQELALDGEYERLGGGSGWALVKETGPAARRALYAHGIKAFVSLLGRLNGNYVYSIGRWSPWTNFNLPQIFKALNAAEGQELLRRNPGADPTDSRMGFWGPMVANATIGGSPRALGSFLSPEEIAEVVEANKDTKEIDQ